MSSSASPLHRAVLHRLQAAPRNGGWAQAASRPDVHGLSPEERAALAAHWQDAAQEEHAAVASFSHLSLELLALGAPAELLASVHAAALDEIRHARLCFSLASTYAGVEITPPAITCRPEMPTEASFVSLAASAARNGCVHETAMALIAAERLSRATDPAVQEALVQIVEDELRHAELAWSVVTWAVRQGGAPARTAASRGFKMGMCHLAQPPTDAPASEHPALSAHGLLSAGALQGAALRALTEVLMPCARALLEGSADAHDTAKPEAVAEIEAA